MAACPRHRQIVVADDLFRSRRSREMQDAFDPEVREERPPTADRPSGCPSHCATLFWRMARARLSSKIAKTRHKLRTEVDFALAVCGRRCATLTGCWVQPKTQGVNSEDDKRISR